MAFIVRCGAGVAKTLRRLVAPTLRPALSQRCGSLLPRESNSSLQVMNRASILSAKIWMPE
jgi:hypothetical protein